MKKLVLAFLVIAAITNATAQNNWSIGVFTSPAGNHSDFTSGMSNANGRFSNNLYMSGTLGILGRYYFGNHWSVQSGMNLSQIGFDYSISNDYSLLKKRDEAATKNNVGIGVIQIPLTAIYALKPNCSNFRLWFGAGISIMNSFEKVNQTKSELAKGDEGTINNVYVNQTVTSNKFIVPTAQFMWGIEKLLKRGNILQGGFIANIGFTNLAQSNVEYSVDNKTYNHTFTNKGTYAGMMLNYYFKPFSKK